MIPMLKYAWLILKHKWFVFLAGLDLGCPIWQLITHDLSKFGRQELPYYGRQFFGKANDPVGWARCWLHHQNVNKHHWEYWIPRTGHYSNGYQTDGEMMMPKEYWLEMVADWFGACRAYDGKWPEPGEWKWLSNGYLKVRLHPRTKEDIELLLRTRGFLNPYYVRD